MNGVACRHMVDLGVQVNAVSVLCVLLLCNPQMRIIDIQIRLYSE